MKIGFLIVGTQKGGTSALDLYLRQHPEIGMSKEKEIHFFDNEEFFSTKPKSYDLYEEKFKEKEGVGIYGEVTPIYMYWPPSMKRIWEYNPKMKIIAILRNPIERAFSHWNMQIALKWESNPFSFCIQHEAERIGEPLSRQKRTCSYIDRGLYAGQIQRIQKYFPKEQVLFLKYEDFLIEQKQSIHQILDFLGVSIEDFAFEYTEALKMNYASSLSESERRCLLKLFDEEISKVEKLLDWDCSDWRSCP